MNPVDITEKLHVRLMQVSDDVINLFMEKKVSEKVAFLALCMSLARMTLVINKDTEVANTFVKVYRKACERNQERKAAEKDSKLLN